MGNCVIVLDDMDAANGCLHYVLGSHRDPQGRRGAGALRRHEVSLSPSLIALLMRCAMYGVKRRTGVGRVEHGGAGELELKAQRLQEREVLLRLRRDRRGGHNFCTTTHSRHAAY